jgi:hypothetical protein
MRRNSARKHSSNEVGAAALPVTKVWSGADAVWLRIAAWPYARSMAAFSASSPNAAAAGHQHSGAAVVQIRRWELALAGSAWL